MSSGCIVLMMRIIYTPKTCHANRILKMLLPLRGSPIVSVLPASIRSCKSHLALSLHDWCSLQYQPATLLRQPRFHSLHTPACWLARLRSDPRHSSRWTCPYCRRSHSDRFVLCPGTPIRQEERSWDARFRGAKLTFRLSLGTLF